MSHGDGNHEKRYSKSEDKSSGRFTRRRYLKAAGTSIVPFISAGVVSGENDDDLVLIDYKIRDGEYVYHEVPKGWKEHVEQTTEIIDDFKSEFLYDENINTIGLQGRDRNGDSENGHYGMGLNGFEILVGVDSKNEARNLPDVYQGIAVKQEEVRLETLACGCYNNVEPDPVVGGLPFGHTGCNGTVGGIVQYNNNPAGITAQHVVEDPGQYGSDICTSPNPIGDPMEQGSRSFGEVVAHVDEIDVAIVEKTTSWYGEASEIREDDWFGNDPVYYRDVGSIWSKNGVKYLCDINEQCYTTGKATGTTGGSVWECEMSISSTAGHCVDLNGEGVRSGPNVAPGDSGSLCYTVDSYDYAGPIFVLTNGRHELSTTNCNDRNLFGNGIGPACYEVDNQISGIDWTWS